MYFRKTNGFFGGRKKEKKHKYYHVLCDERDIRRNDVSVSIFPQHPA